MMYAAARPLATGLWLIRISVPGFLLLIALFLITWGKVGLSLDEGMYIDGQTRLRLYGDLPFLDFQAVSGLGTYYAGAFFQSLPWLTVWEGARLHLLLSLCGCFWGVHLLLRQRGNSIQVSNVETMLCAVGIVVLSPRLAVDHRWDSLALLLIGIRMATSNPDCLLRACVAGMVFGVAPWFTESSAIFVVFAIIWLSRQGTRSQVLVFFAALLLSTAVIAAVLWRTGVLMAMIDAKALAAFWYISSNLPDSSTLGAARSPSGLLACSIPLLLLYRMGKHVTEYGLHGDGLFAVLIGCSFLIWLWPRWRPDYFPFLLPALSLTKVPAAMARSLSGRRIQELLTWGLLVSLWAVGIRRHVDSLPVRLENDTVWLSSAKDGAMILAFRRLLVGKEGCISVYPYWNTIAPLLERTTCGYQRFNHPGPASRWMDTSYAEQIRGRETPFLIWVDAADGFYDNIWRRAELEVGQSAAAVRAHFRAIGGFQGDSAAFTLYERRRKPSSEGE